MKTSIKADLRYTKPCREVQTGYYLQEIENEAEIQALIKEAEVTLKPCAHCGNEAYIGYFFVPGNTGPRRVAPGSTEIKIVESPHSLQGRCSKCQIQTNEWHAEDNEEDFKEALRLITETWNKRPE